MSQVHTGVIYDVEKKNKALLQEPMECFGEAKFDCLYYNL